MQPTVAAVIGVDPAAGVVAAAAVGAVGCAGLSRADGLDMSAPAAIRTCPVGMVVSCFGRLLLPNALCTAAAAACPLAG